jgi:transcriptional regulator with XRE-family HTH domain
MRSGLHKEPTQAVLAANLKAVFAKRHLTARGVARAIGHGLSNKTVSNLVNGVGAPQFDTLLAVAQYLHIPLWQLLCPSIGSSHFGDDAIHTLVKSFCSLSEIGRARLLQNLDDAVVAEQARHAPHNTNSA